VIRARACFSHDSAIQQLVESACDRRRRHVRNLTNECHAATGSGNGRDLHDRVRVLAQPRDAPFQDALDRSRRRVIDRFAAFENGDDGPVQKECVTLSV
jgi:hypothetical protein